jgi:hypothetical protein
MWLATLTARNRKLRLPDLAPGQHRDSLPDGATAIDQKRGYVSGVESVVDLATSSNQNKKP